jgi:hypothetical protein
MSRWIAFAALLGLAAFAQSCETPPAATHSETPAPAGPPPRDVRAQGEAAPVEAFRDSVEDKPADWTGPVFKLSHQYPTSRPATPAGGYPWEQFDFRSQPAEYANAVLAAARADLEALDWDPTKAPTPKWFHAPWMATGPASGGGREFIHGMTVERTGRLSELVQGGSDTVRFRNVAVGFYNDVGGWTFGQVWANPTAPDVSKAAFENGAASIKLLFTEVTAADVPYLMGSMEWDANLYESGAGKRMPKKMRLLQVDIAVRDQRNDARTGWVMGTFVFNGNLPGAAPLDHLTPVGLMWGNDPDLVPESGHGPSESWINPATGTYQHLGWAGRLNGPVDNPRSSCLSCHSTAQAPALAEMVPPANLPNAQKLLWFRNVRAGERFKGDAPSLDYSLQMAVAFEKWSDWNEQNHPAPPSPERMRRAARSPRIHVTRDIPD